MSEELRASYNLRSLRHEAEGLKLLIAEAEEAEGVINKLFQYVEAEELAPEVHAERCEILKAAIREKLKERGSYEDELKENRRRLTSLVSLFSEILGEA